MRQQAALFLVASLPGACIGAGFPSSPVTPGGFRYTGFSDAAIELAWERAPDSKTGKPVQYRISHNTKVLAKNLDALSFTVRPSMFPDGKIRRDTPYLIRLQSVDESVRTGGNLPTTSRWTTVKVWIQGKSKTPSSCKPA